MDVKVQFSYDGAAMFSQTAEYALRAVVWLADSDDDVPLGVQKIAAGTQVPACYLSKVLQALSRDGLVVSRRGVGGGHRLARPPSEITVLDVIKVVDPIKRIKGCPLGLESHSTRLCGMHHRLDHALGQVEEILSQSTIADLLKTTDRPYPMKECAAKDGVYVARIGTDRHVGI